MNVTYSIHTLTEDEIRNILESLLFASSVDVCADWFKDDSLKSMEIAKKIRKMFPEVTLKNIYIYDGEEKEQFNDDHSEDIMQFFPEIRKEKITA
jgi:hypothetical protein